MCSNKPIKYEFQAALMSLLLHSDSDRQSWPSLVAAYAKHLLLNEAYLADKFSHGSLKSYIDKCCRGERKFPLQDNLTPDEKTCEMQRLIRDLVSFVAKFDRSRVEIALGINEKKRNLKNGIHDRIRPATLHMLLTTAVKEHGDIAKGICDATKSSSPEGTGISRGEAIQIGIQCQEAIQAISGIQTAAEAMQLAACSYAACSYAA